MILRYIKVTNEYVEFLRRLRNNNAIRSNVGSGKFITKQMQKKWWKRYKKGYFDYIIKIIMYNTFPIGYVNYTIDEEDEVITIGASIHPYYHGKGIGKAVYKHLLIRCEKLNYEVKLWVYADNVVAHNLYKNIGFEETSSYMHENGREVIIMEYSKLKRLAGVH